MVSKTISFIIRVLNLKDDKMSPSQGGQKERETFTQQRAKSEHISSFQSLFLSIQSLSNKLATWKTLQAPRTVNTEPVHEQTNKSKKKK